MKTKFYGVFVMLFTGLKAFSQCPVISIPNTFSLTNCTSSQTLSATSNYSANITSKWIGPGNTPLFSTGTSTSVVKLNHSGTYTVVFSDTVSNCVTQNTLTVYNNVFKPDFILVSPQNYSIGCGQSFSVTTIQIVNASTNPPGGPLTYTFGPVGITIPPTGFLSPISSYTAATCGSYLALVRDNTSLCTSSFEFVVSCNTSFNGTLIATQSPTNPCVGSSATLTGTGANTYTWSPGNAVGSPATMITTTALSVYTLSGMGSNGCIGNSTIGVVANTACSDVWPGDANSDGVVGTTDVLEIGLGFNSTGAARTPGGNTYVSQYAANWTGTVSSGKNLNHADCNGDGTINSNDTLAIFNNFSLTHAFKPGGAPVSDPDISLVVDNNIVYEGQWNKADVILGSNANAINQLYGVAFDIDFDNSLIETGSVYLVYPSSFIDNSNQNVIFRKSDFTSGKLFAATVRTDGNNVNGNGKIAEFYFKVKSGVPANSSINLSVSNATKIDADGVSGVLSNGTAAPVISNNLVGLKNITAETLNIEVFPNPAKNMVYINSASASRMTYVVSDLIGRRVQNGVFEKQGKLDVSLLQNGAYIIQLSDGISTEYRKIIIEK